MIAALILAASMALAPPSPAVCCWETIATVDDDSARGIRIYKGTSCTTPAGAAAPRVIVPGTTSAAWWKRPVSLRHYGKGTRLQRYSIETGAPIGGVTLLPDPADPNVGRCYPAGGAGLGTGVEYVLVTASAA